jgi:hypothetical protein
LIAKIFRYEAGQPGFRDVQSQRPQNDPESPRFGA